MDNQKTYSNKIYFTILNIILFIAMFSMIGFLVPRIYWENFDSSTYYTVELPIQTDKPVYLSGDLMHLSMNTTSLITTSATSIHELVLVQSNGSQTEISRSFSPEILVKGDDQASLLVSLPEGLEPGSYMWRGIVTYRVHNIDKSFYWYSESFLIVNE